MCDSLDLLLELGHGLLSLGKLLSGGGGPGLGLLLLLGLLGLLATLSSSSSSTSASSSPASPTTWSSSTSSPTLSTTWSSSSSSGGGHGAIVAHGGHHGVGDPSPNKSQGEWEIIIHDLQLIKTQVVLFFSSSFFSSPSFFSFLSSSFLFSLAASCSALHNTIL